MSIPRIQPYSMPTTLDVPQNQVPWELDGSRAVLLIHDVQQYFLNAFTAKSVPLTELIANTALLRRHCVALGIPVCYTAQPGGQSIAQRGLLMDFWGPGIPDDPQLCRIVEGLSPAASDTVIQKTRYSAFHRTELLDFMNKRHRNQLIVCGVYAHIGCLATALDAFMNGVKPFMVIDGVADFSLADHLMALNHAVRRCAVAFSTAQVVAALVAGSLKVRAAS